MLVIIDGKYREDITTFRVHLDSQPLTELGDAPMLIQSQDTLRVHVLLNDGKFTLLSRRFRVTRGIRNEIEMWDTIFCDGWKEPQP